MEILDEIAQSVIFLEQNISIDGRFCGGLAGLICPDGYLCKLDGDYTESAGYCIKLDSSELGDEPTAPQVGNVPTMDECIKFGGTWKTYGLRGLTYCQIPGEGEDRTLH